MGVDGVGSKVAPSIPKTVEAKPVEAPKPAAPPAPAVEAKKPEEGFDLTKKKLMSVSGRYTAPKTQLESKADLKDLVSAQRSAVNAGSTSVGSKNLHEGMKDTASSKGQGPGARPEASEFTAQKGTPPTKAEAEALTKKGYADPSSGKAVETLEKTKKPISGKDMMNAIVSGSSDTDKHAASTEYKDLSKFVKANWKDMSPEAQANWKTYEAEVKVQQGQKPPFPGIPAKRFDEMVSKMEVQTGKAAIQKDFGVTPKDGTAKWSGEELSRMHESLAKMPAGDVAKLKGMEFVRNEKASAKAQAELDEKGGGTIAGEYQPNVDAKDGKRVKPAQIEIYDAAFPAGNSEAARKESIHVITHEAGHAIEGKARDDAYAKMNAAMSAEKPFNAKTNAANDARNAVVGDENTSGTYNKAWKDFGATSGADKPKMAFHSAQKGVDKAIDKLNSAKTQQDIDAAEKELTAAKAKRDTAATGMSGHKKEGLATELATQSDRLESATRDLAKARVAQAPYTEKFNTALKEAKDLGTIKETKTTAADGTKTTTYEAKNSKELDAYLKARGNEKAVSGYGKEAQEGYAEAYALYQRDPGYMKKNFPNQYKFFHKNHQNSAD